MSQVKAEDVPGPSGVKIEDIKMEGEDEEAAGGDEGEVDIPFEFVGEVAGAGAVAKAGHVESGAASRHVSEDVKMRWG